MKTERHMTESARRCGSPIETKPGYPDTWRLPRYMEHC